MSLLYEHLKIVYLCIHIYVAFGTVPETASVFRGMPRTNKRFVQIEIIIQSFVGRDKRDFSLSRAV